MIYNILGPNLSTMKGTNPLINLNDLALITKLDNK